MLKIVLISLFAVVSVHATADASAGAEADPDLLVTEQRQHHAFHPGVVVRGTQLLPGFGYKEFKAVKPPVSVRTYDTRRTLYPDPIVEPIHRVSFVDQYVPPVYSLLRAAPAIGHPYGYIENFIDDDDFHHHYY